MGVLRTDAWNELNFGPVRSCMPGVRVFTPRAARSFSRKVPKLRLKQTFTCSAACSMQCWAGTEARCLGTGSKWFSGGTERAIKPENERFQLRTLGTGWSMKKICFGTAGNEKDMLWNGWQWKRYALERLAMKKICFGTAGNEKDMLWNGWQGVKRGS